MKGLSKVHAWEWIVGYLKDIHGQEKGLDLIYEPMSIIPQVSNICQFWDELTHMEQWTTADYKYMAKVYLGVLVLLLEGHSDHL